MPFDDEEEIAQPDLSLIFATNATNFNAVKLFIDRDEECLAFDMAVQMHHNHITDSHFDSQDVVSPRRNVLTFFGAGGVGKSSLSRALEIRHSGDDRQQRQNWPVMQRQFEKPVEARVDLASDSGIDLERILLSIRAAVGRLGRPMHAFDITFSRYWEHAHPDTPLDEFLRGDGALRRASEAIRLPEQMQEGLAEIAGAFGSSSAMVSAASRIALAIGRAARRHRALRHAIEDCRRLKPLLQAEPDLESLSYYPHLLSWDLSELSRKLEGQFHVTVFLDTFEDVTRQTDRSFERLLQRLIWLMPNVLFVISGRNRLDWADPRSAGDLQWSGPESWPGLAIGSSVEPAQHMVGHLSYDDSARFLSLRLRNGDEPVINADIRAQIARASGGYPLYLDLAVARYIQIVGAGARPEPTDFVSGFPGLVSRVLRDLDSDERRLVRILSLLDSFDVELAVSLANLESEAVAVRLTHRLFVMSDEDAPFPYSIHRLIRREVQLASGGADAFTPADWTRYAQRAFDTLGERYHRASRAGARRTANSALNQALRLADEYRLDLGWCLEASYVFIEDCLWEGSVRPLIGADEASPAAALARTMLAVVDHRWQGRLRGDVMSTDLRETARALNEVLSAGLLTGDARDLATYYAAEAARELGDAAEAERLIRSISGSSDTRIASLASKGLVHPLRRRGHFRELRDLVNSQPREAVWLQMAGTLSWSQGLFEQAKQEYKQSREQFIAMGYLGNAEELLGSLGFVCGLIGDDGSENTGIVAESIAAVQTSRNRWAALMAQLGAAALAADGSEVSAQRIMEIRDQGRAAGLTSIQSYARLILNLNATLSRSVEAMRRARADLAAAVTDGDFLWLLEICDFWSDDGQAGGTTPTADWLDGLTETRDRWRQVVRNRQD
ncbi:tetratricopeptide repeat protein [Streptomyces sp. NPDC050564]|uniref:tetratricopeptide repeat protein n=1 Tax=Streptomyces sp. NPDC050564 TaxID=3365631 RepID=UPI0037B5DD47